MMTMLVKAYDALREIGVSDDKARRVAEVLATNQPRFAAIRSDLRVLKWQVGVPFAALIAAFWLLLRIAGKTGAIGF